MTSEGKRLTPLRIKKLEKIGYHRDRGDGAVPGLYLQIVGGRDGTVSKSWTLRYISPVSGKPRWMGLGPIHFVGPAEAREEAVKWQRVKLSGLDPIEERNKERAARRLEAAKAITFRIAAEQYIAAHQAGWKNTRHGSSGRGRSPPTRTRC
jgi:hypothetical protein